MKDLIIGVLLAVVIVVGFKELGGFEYVNNLIIDYQLEQAAEQAQKEVDAEGIDGEFVSFTNGDWYFVRKYPFGIEHREKVEIDRSEWGLGL